MSGPGPRNQDDASNGWTVETLKMYIDAILLERAKHMADMFAERDKAIKEFKDTTKENFASRNEIQAAMKDAAIISERATAALVATLMPRSEAAVQLHRNEQDIKAITDRVNSQDGRGQGMKDSWGWLVGVVGLLIGFAGVIAVIWAALRK